MEKKELRAGIIGSGFAARFHLDALRRVCSVNIEVVGAYSRDQKKLKRFSDEKDITPFHSLDSLIKNCDILHLCTPPITHETLAVKVLRQDKSVIIEKPFTGYFGGDKKEFNGDNFQRKIGLEQALGSIERMLNAEKLSKGLIMYAENWVYAPAIQKEREIIEKTGAQILWMQGEESHSGSHSLDYGKWHMSGADH